MLSTPGFPVSHRTCIGISSSIHYHTLVCLPLPINLVAHSETTPCLTPLYPISQHCLALKYLLKDICTRIFSVACFVNQINNLNSLQQEPDCISSSQSAVIRFLRVRETFSENWRVPPFYNYNLCETRYSSKTLTKTTQQTESIIRYENLAFCHWAKH